MKICLADMAICVAMFSVAKTKVCRSERNERNERNKQSAYVGGVSGMKLGEQELDGQKLSE